MIYCHRGPGFLAVVWFGSSPILSPPLSRQQVVFLAQSSCVSPVEPVLTGKGDMGGGVKLYNREKVTLLYTLFMNRSRPLCTLQIAADF